MTREEAIAECNSIWALIEHRNPGAIARAKRLDVMLRREDWWTAYISEKAGSFADECEMLFAPRRWKRLGNTFEDAYSSVYGEYCKLKTSIERFYANAWADREREFDQEEPSAA